MPSIIQGFEYDIFISYRQKDNKGDRWVSEFVEALKTELESTFKDEVNTYFDINPHDGLLETHDVDASLSEKLRSLVFIPVISRTYCDPRSFAWEHEFRAFIRQAGQDKYGLKVTLHSGNVGSRILPVRIHELDDADRALLENELGGVLRAIDFTYREPGVNRPLTPSDDENKNLNGTKYRNQINKTANAVREIITSLQTEQGTAPKEKTLHKEPWEEPETKERGGKSSIGRLPGRWLKGIIAIAAILLLAAGLLSVFKIHARNSEKTIAVLPFENIGSSTEHSWFGDALTDEVITQLYNISDLEVRSRTSVMRYRGTRKSIQTIRREIDVNYIIEGTYQIVGEQFRASIKLFNTRKDEQLWGEMFEGTWGDVFQMQTDIATNTASVLKAVISPEEKARIEKKPTRNPVAYMNYLSANVMSNNALNYVLLGNRYIDSTSFGTAIVMYDKAIADDPLFALAYARRAIARSWGYYTGNLDESHVKKCKADIDRALEIDKELVEAQVALGFYYYYCNTDYQKALTHFRTASRQDPANYQPLFYMAAVYRKMGDWKSSQDLIMKVIEKEPHDALTLTNIGLSFFYLHSYDTSIYYHQKAIEAMPEWSGPYYNLIESLILKYGDTELAGDVLDSAAARTGERMIYHRVIFSVYEEKYDEALKLLSGSTDADFGFPGVKHLIESGIYMLLNEKRMAVMYNDTALVILKQMVADYPDNAYAYAYCGLAYAGAGRKEEAITSGKKAVELSSMDAMMNSEMEVNLAKIYLLTGNYSDALFLVDQLLNKPSGFSLNLTKVDPEWKLLTTVPGYDKLAGDRAGTR